MLSSRTTPSASRLTTSSSSAALVSLSSLSLKRVPGTPTSISVLRKRCVAESLLVSLADPRRWQPYYHFLTDDIYFSTSPSNIVSVPADLGSIPVLQRGGSIVSRRDVVRRSAPLQLKDPVTLVAAISRTNRAKGTLYLDDGESLNVGDYAYRSFSIEASGPNELQIASDEISSGAKGGSTLSDVLIGQIVIKGLINKPRCIKLAGQEQGLDFEWKEGKRTWGKTANVLVIKDAHVPAVEDWRVQMSFGAGRKCDSVPALSREEQLQSPLCAPGHFRCENKGFVPSCILTSRVGDGICDCCDGSDEPGGACADTCAKEAAEHKRAKAEEERNFKAGSKIRESYVKHGAKEQERLRAAVEAKLVNIKELEQRESAAKRALERAESAAADDIERLKDSRLFQRISEMQEAIKSLRSERERLHDDIENLSGILSQLKRDFNPNYQDMAVLGATRAFTEWSDVRDGGNHDDAPALNVRQLTALEGEDALELMDSINTRVGKPRFTTKQSACPARLLKFIQGTGTDDSLVHQSCALRNTCRRSGSRCTDSTSSRSSMCSPSSASCRPSARSAPT